LNPKPLAAEINQSKRRALSSFSAPFAALNSLSFVLGRRWSPAPAGKFSPHAGAATHGNGISKLATHHP